MWADKPGIFSPRNGLGFTQMEKLDLSAIMGTNRTLVLADLPLRTLYAERVDPATYACPHITLLNGVTTAKDLHRIGWKVLFLNREEANVLGGDDGVATLLAKHGGYCIVTQGQEPALYFANGKKREFARRQIKCVNPVGGGDAFAAGVIAGLESGMSISFSLAMGHAAAEIVINEFGCQSENMSWRNIKRIMEA
jgi:hypothetical protein